MQSEQFRTPPRDKSKHARMSRYKFVSNSDGCNAGSKLNLQSMFKTPPAWFGGYRNRCIERVNEKRKRERQNRFEKRWRWIVDDIPECHEDDGDSKDEIIREVMSSIFNDCESETDFETFVNDYESYIQELHYELYNDLEKDDLFCEDMANLSEEEMKWNIESQYSVTCFDCKKNPFELEYQNGFTLIKCKACPFRFFVKFHIDMETLHQKLMQIIDEHSTLCNLEIQFNFFSTEQQYYSHNAQIYCCKCKFERFLF